MFSQKQIEEIFADIGVLPDVSADDNGKVLEVIVGAWGKSLFNKANVVNSSDIPETLTEEWEKIFREGIHINGTYKGFKNPIIFPSDASADMHIFGSSSNGVSSLNWCRINNHAFEVLDQLLYFNLSRVDIPNLRRVNGKVYPAYPADTALGQLIFRKGTLEYYVPVSQTGITSGDVVALDSDLGKALIDHLDVEINGYRARYQYTSGNYVVYSYMEEADSGVNLQINMISYNTTNGELSFNQMKFAPVV